MSSPSTSRAPPTRKSLSAVVSNQKHHAAHRKRAKSMASSNPDELTPRSKRRRSLAPKKSILKQSNGPSGLSLINPLSSSQNAPPRPSQPLEDITMNFTRVSALNQDRRVSFAPNAHVRLIPKESQHTNGSSTPPSSPMDSSVDSPNTSQENTRPEPDSSPIKNDRPARRSSLRQSTGGDGDGEASMDLASDTSYLEDDDDDNAGSAGEPSTPQKRRESVVSEGSSMDIDDSQDDMDMTMNTAVSGRPSIARPRRSSTRPRRESTAPRESGEGSKRTEYTIPLEESLKGEVAPSANWLALQAVMNHSEGPTSPPPNIDIETAAARLLLAGHDLPMPAIDEEADTTLSSEGGDSTGSIGGKTMDFTALTGGIHRNSMRGDVTTAFPRVSLRPPVPNVQPPVPSSEQALPPASASKPSAIPIPASSGPGIFRSKAASFVPTPRAASSSPVKVAESTPTKSMQRPKPPSFSAAFAPPSVVTPKKSLFTVTAPSSVAPKSPARQTPIKRPHPVDETTAVTESPSKKLIVAVEGGAKMQAIPKTSPVKTVPPPSPGKKVMVPRRPSDYLTRPSLSKLSSAFRGPPPQPTIVASPERPSATQPSVTPTKAPVAPAEVPQTPKSPRAPQLTSKGSTPTVDCERETVRQLDAELRIASSPRRNSSPVRTPAVRRSMVAPSLTTSPWLGRVRPSLAANLRNEAEGDEEGEEEDQTEGVDVLESLSDEVRARLPGTVDELLHLVGGEFMDNMVVRRRSTMGRTKEQYLDVPITAADYAVAMDIEFPQLTYYDFLTSQLNDLIGQIEEKQEEMDDVVKINPPPCFIAYAEGGEDQLPELKTMLESIRSMVRLQTKIKWYQYRLEGISDLYTAVAKREKESLEDLSITQDLLTEITPTLEYVEVQHAQIMAELERERAAVVEIDKCDPKALAEVKSSIADNATQLKMLEEEVVDIRKDIDGSNKRGEDFRVEQKTLQQKIDYAGKMIHHSSTPQDLFGQIKGEINLLQYISGWKPLKITPSRVNLEYDGRILVTIPCKNWIPILETCDVRLRAPNPLHRPRQDWLPLFTQFTVDAARSRLLKGRFGRRSIRKMMDKLSSFWTCCDVVRHEIMVLRSKYAVKLHYDPTQSADFTIEAPILFEKSSSKILVEFDLNAKILDKWPLSIHDVPARVKIGYVLDDSVTINVDTLLTAVKDRLREATLAENFGILVEACVEVAVLYP